MQAANSELHALVMHPMLRQDPKCEKAQSRNWETKDWAAGHPCAMALAKQTASTGGLEPKWMQPRAWETT